MTANNIRLNGLDFPCALCVNFTFLCGKLAEITQTHTQRHRQQRRQTVTVDVIEAVANNLPRQHRWG